MNAADLKPIGARFLLGALIGTVLATVMIHTTLLLLQNIPELLRLAWTITTLVPFVLAGVYVFVIRGTIQKEIAQALDVDRLHDRRILLRLAKQNKDVVLILLFVSVLFLYRLQTWNIVRLEEWVMYRFFVDGNWLQYRTLQKLNSIFLPTFLISSIFPFDTVLGYRYVTALLSILGGGVYYVAIRSAANSKRVAAFATLIMVTHTWTLLFGRMFFVSWSGLLLSSLTLLVFIHFKERGSKASGIINGVSILNFAHAVFFVFPFFVAERVTRRNTMSLRHHILPLVLFAIIITPSIFVFLYEQPRRVNQEITQTGSGPAPQTITLPVLDTEIYWPFSPISAFKMLHDYLSITDGPRNFTTFSLTNGYSLLSALLLVYPLIALKLSRWDYRVFFAMGALLCITTMVVFPMTLNVSYTWVFFLFLAPLLAEGAVQSPFRTFQVFSLILLLTVVGLQAVDSTQDIILYDHEEAFDTRIGPYVENETFLLGAEAKATIDHSPLQPLDGYNYTVASCAEIENSDRPTVLAVPFCSGEHRELVEDTRLLFFYR